MNHYQKIATVLVRFAGITAAAVGVFGLLYGLAYMASGTRLTAEQADRFGASIWYVGLGLALYLLAGPLGRLMARRLD